MDKNNFKNDIERDERVILIVSWLGIISAFAVIISSLLKM